MKVEEVVSYLAQRNLKSSPETVRRWIRAGKLQACLTSRKAGYQVTVADLDVFINTKDWQRIRSGHEKNRREYLAGYDEGLQTASQNYEERLKAMLKRGFYERTFGIDRVELQRAVLADTATRRSQAILIGINQTFFGLYVTSKPWSKVQVHFSGHWMTWADAQVIVDWTKVLTGTRLETLTHADAVKIVVRWAQETFQGN